MKAIANKSKVISTRSLSMIKAGPASKSGPLGSSAHYAKGSKVNMTPNWNPMHKKANTYGVNGV